MDIAMHLRTTILLAKEQARMETQYSSPQQEKGADTEIHIMVFTGLKLRIP